MLLGKPSLPTSRSYADMEIEGKNGVDLFLLFQIVCNYGGFEVVERRDLWPSVTEEYMTTTERNLENARSCYASHLAEFERAVEERRRRLIAKPQLLRVFCSLQSGLPNEVDWAFNELLVLSQNSQMLLESIPTLLSTILEHAPAVEISHFSTLGSCNYIHSTELDSDVLVAHERMCQILTCLACFAESNDENAQFIAESLNGFLESCLRMLGSVEVLNLFLKLLSLVGQYLKLQSNDLSYILLEQLNSPDKCLYLAALDCLTELLKNPFNHDKIELNVEIVDRIVLIAVEEEDSEIVSLSIEFLYYLFLSGFKGSRFIFKWLQSQIERPNAVNTKDLSQWLSFNFQEGNGRNIIRLSSLIKNTDLSPNQLLDAIEAEFPSALFPSPSEPIYFCMWNGCGKKYESTKQLKLHVDKTHLNENVKNCLWLNCNAPSSDAHISSHLASLGAHEIFLNLNVKSRATFFGDSDRAANSILALKQVSSLMIDDPFVLSCLCSLACSDNEFIRRQACAALAEIASK